MSGLPESATKSEHHTIERGRGWDRQFHKKHCIFCLSSYQKLLQKKICKGLLNSLVIDTAITRENKQLGKKSSYARHPYLNTRRNVLLFL